MKIPRSSRDQERGDQTDWLPLGKLLPLFLIALVAISCSPNAVSPVPSEPPTPIPTTDFFQLVFPTILPTAVTPDLPALWLALEQRTPVAYTTPLPPSATTPLDGAYVKFNPTIESPIQCRRCPDWKPEGGIWKIDFDKGVFRVVHAKSGWKSIASYAVSQDTLYLFNDPYCTDAVGVYTWTLKGRQLELRVIHDDCSMNLRSLNLIEYSWASCQPPNREAAVSGHWPVPEGCE